MGLSGENCDECDVEPVRIAGLMLFDPGFCFDAIQIQKWELDRITLRERK